MFLQSVTGWDGSVQGKRERRRGGSGWQKSVYRGLPKAIPGSISNMYLNRGELIGGL